MRLVLLAALTLAGTGCRSDVALLSPRPPETIQAQTTAWGVDLNWSAVEGASRYTAYSAAGTTVSRETWQDLGGDDHPSTTTHVTIPIGGPTAFVVTAFFGARESEDSAVVHAEPAPPEVLPAIPTRTFRTFDGDARLGTSLDAADLNGDGIDELLAGAPDPTGTGEAFVWAGGKEGPADLPDGRWSFGATLTQTRFGADVLGADADGDGIGDLLVSEPEDDTGAADAGAVHRFPGSGALSSSNWTRTGTNANARMGGSMAAGDVNGDGAVDLFFSYATTAVGFGPAGLPTPDWTLVYNTNGAGPVQALEMADLDGDGLDDVVTGRPETGLPGVGGLVNIHTGTTGGISSLDLWQSSSPEIGSVYGAAFVALDVNGDSRPELVIGAPGTQSGAGRVELHRGRSGQLPQPLVGWGELGAAPGDAMGAALAGADFEIGPEPRGDLLVGEPGYSGGMGRVRLYRGPDDEDDVALVEEWTAPGVAVGERFGSALAVGDYNGDGLDDVAVGAPRATVAGNIDAGVVYLFLGNPRRGPLVSAGPFDAVQPGIATSPRGASFADPVPGRRHACEWDWGDGSPPTRLDPCTPESVGAVSHVWNAGDWQVTLRVESSSGLFGEGAARVRVR